MNPIEIQADFLTSYKKIEILILHSGKKKPDHYCNATVLEETPSGARLVCELPCVEACGQTFLIQRAGFDQPGKVLLSEEAPVTVGKKVVGYIHNCIYV